jgi:hypothetical protein
MQPTEHPHPLPRSRALCDLAVRRSCEWYRPVPFTGEPRGVTGQVIHLNRVRHALTPPVGVLRLLRSHRRSVDGLQTYRPVGSSLRCTP